MEGRISFGGKSFDFFLLPIFSYKVFIYRLRHNEITVYMVGIILTLMTYVLIFHWYEDHFPSRYFSTGRLIWYLSHTWKHSWPAQMIFSVISNFLLHCIALYVFLFSLSPFPCHQGLSWPMRWMNYVLPLKFSYYIVFSFHDHLFRMLYWVLDFHTPGPLEWIPLHQKRPLARNP